MGRPVPADAHQDRRGAGESDEAVDDVPADPERQRDAQRADHKADEQVAPPYRHHHVRLLGVIDSS
jgi:hypothetical protein